MTPQDFFALYLSLFAGRPDVYAIRSEWTERKPDGTEHPKAAYIPSKYDGKKDSLKEKIARITSKVGSSDYGPEAIRAHVRGEEFLGVYPLHDDSTVKFFALDFDGETPDEAWKETMRHYRTLTNEAQIPVYIETSRSGNGFHVWGFLDAPLDAGIVRRAVKQFINKSEFFDRMFPNQSRVTEHRPYGNLIALPLSGPKVKDGKNSFIDPETREPFADQKTFLTTVERVSVARMIELAEAAPEIAEEKDVKVRSGMAEGDLPGASKLIDPRFGCEWVRWQLECPEEVQEPEWYALACNLAQLKHGRELFHHISSQDSSRYTVASTDAKFDQAIEKNAPHSCEYIRENLSGPPCNCDKRFPGKVYRPYDLASVPLFDLMATVSGDGSVSEANEGMGQVYEWAQSVEKDPLIGMGLPTGIKPLDDHIGFRDSTLNVLAARPSIGKTALAMDMAYRAADSNIPVYFFSLEMSREQLWRRMICRAAGVSASKMRKGQLTKEEWARIDATMADIRNRERFPLYIDDSTRDIRRMMDIAYRLKEEHGHGIVMADYLGLMDWHKGENEYAGITRNSKESKLAAKATRMPWLVLHQFNRLGDDTGIGAETSDGWLRSSGQIEQDADVILYMLGERNPGVQEREIVKQKDRDGEAGIRVMLDFNPMLMQFGAQGTWFSLAQNNLPASISVAPTLDPTQIEFGGSHGFGEYATALNANTPPEEIVW